MTRHVSRKNQMSVLGLRAAALLAAVVAGTGCAESIGDIDRTQPDLIAKKHFDGQWFLRETIVDVQRTVVSDFELGRGSSRRAFIERMTRLVVIGGQPPAELTNAVMTGPAGPPRVPAGNACRDGEAQGANGHLQSPWGGWRCCWVGVSGQAGMSLACAAI